MKDELYYREKGSILFITLIIFITLNLMGMALVKIASLESKMSEYVYKSQQAQEAADGGIEWLSIRIFEELNNEENLSKPTLPVKLLGDESIEVEMPTGAGEPKALIEKVEKYGQTSVPDDINYCEYGFISTGIFQGARKIVEVKIVYSFLGGYYKNESDFISRIYQDSGEISSYEILTSIE